ncbi:hypothetical protein DY240_25515 [Jiangella rhizosphaerae]|uniref:Uncharacterized protein n=2 Tax=Jiangella rhizosphaerae TaxID=2293569 RepID=A0A418KIX7_9ACTN|nr:hypothetical protein DY240_25515 [Jiangella rhizosphaerae]
MAVVVALATFPLLVTGCQDDGSDDTATARPRPTGSPVGAPVLPDLVPEPPVDVHTKDNGDGWQIEFSSVLVNVGEGEFLLFADRPTADDPWVATQGIAHDGGGVEVVPSGAEVEWGGDGHDHWHVRRVVTYRLVPIDDSGTPAPDGGRTDTKVGFCIYDFGRELDGVGPDDAVFGREGCQPEDALSLTMGLSPGWGDTYEWNLPGQSIDVTDLPDGPYRLWTEADEGGHFAEVTTDNNTTWVDVELTTAGGGARTAVVTAVGPTAEAAGNTH